MNDSLRATAPLCARVAPAGSRLTSMTAKRVALLLVATAVLALAAPAAAGGALRWPDATVTYRNKTTGADGAAVRRALRWWNATPGRLSFVRATGGKRAEVTIDSVFRPRVAW